MFSLIILGEPLSPEEDGAQAYQLNHLMERTFAFPTDPEDGVEEVSVRGMRLSIIGRLRGRITLEPDPNDGRERIYEMLEEDLNAREEIFEFVDRLNTDLTRKNDFDKDFIMKSCLVLTDLGVAYKVQNFSVANLSKIRERWEGIKSAIERTVDLANTFGIDRDNLTSANALIPVIYYLLQRPKLTLRGTTAFEVQNAGRIRQWLVMCLLNGVFGGASDNMLRDIRAVLQKHPAVDHDFPTDEANLVIKKAGRTASFDDVAINEILAITYGRQQTFLALSVLYDDCAWGTAKFHQDHIFPRSMFKAKDLVGTGRASWLSEKDRLGNLCLLWSRENQEKSDQPFEDWLRTRDTSFRQRHLIPEDPKLWKFERFGDFLKAREKLIAQRLKAVL